ncbi:protein of unassigned function [Methylobacterium oryzae CBMB20]|uniref:Protein of unassigned function n=1 Tax=Methylobacterium oryzae CBMB20 TaxID=693986 RepID=A0A089QEF3_9HYPH|nr:protein of unassigned function [Methylobacterium oryzae CBMB20]
MDLVAPEAAGRARRPSGPEPDRSRQSAGRLRSATIPTALSRPGVRRIPFGLSPSIKQRTKNPQDCEGRS